MSSPSNFGGTAIGGIQDISVLLPLVGTEQREEHVGSSLDKGFFYSSVTPLFIFGSLWIVRASFNILVASLTVREYRFLGAQKLDDGGFISKGVVAPMTALDPDHLIRFLAETRLEAMLKDEHIKNVVENLTVSWGPRIVWWNLICTLIFSTCGLLLYLTIILESEHPAGIHILRVLGSALCVNAAQFMIQLCVLIILKTRLLFVTINRLANVENIDISLYLNPKHSWKREPWDPDVASELCIWALEKRLSFNRLDPESSGEKDIIAHSTSRNPRGILRQMNRQRCHAFKRILIHSRQQVYQGAGIASRHCRFSPPSAESIVQPKQSLKGKNNSMLPSSP